MELGKYIVENESFGTHVYEECVNQLFRAIGVDDWPDNEDGEITTIVSKYVGININNQFDWRSYEFG
jgi:hypothetical protein